MGQPRSTSDPARPRLAVATTFPIFPARGGGQSRVFNLYRQLARVWDIDVVCMTYDDHAGSRLVAPGLREVRVPMSQAHRNADRAILAELGGVSVTDVLMPELFHLTPDYQRVFTASAADAFAVVASHPYLLPAIRAVSPAPLWYEAHNVESALKRSILPDTPLGRRLLSATIAIEQAACDESALLFTCSADDAATLRQDFGLDPAKLMVVPNGVDLETVTYCPPAERAALRARMGLTGHFVVLFVGSWHQPNIDAVEDIFRMAARLPDIAWIMMGSVGDYFSDHSAPENVGFLGVVDEETKDVTLACVDCAINPMRSGSGTNLKMLDYFAAGVPVISTAHGMRGLSAVPGTHIMVAGIDDFAAAVMNFRSSGSAVGAQVAAARHLAEQTYDWRVIADRFLAEIRHHPGAFAPGTAPKATLALDVAAQESECP